MLSYLVEHSPLSTVAGAHELKPARRQQQPAAVQGMRLLDSSWSHLSIPLLFTTRFSRSLCSKTVLTVLPPPHPFHSPHFFPRFYPCSPFSSHLSTSMAQVGVEAQSGRLLINQNYSYSPILYSRRGCYLAEHSSGLRENLSLCLNTIILPTGIIPTRYYSHTNTITTIATITTTREKTADLISTVVALIALLLSGLQLTQRLLATGCTICKCDRIISGNLTKCSKCHWHWLQLRFTVTYEGSTFCLPLDRKSVV